MEALLPGFYAGGLATVLDYLPHWSREPLVYVDDPLGVERAAEELQGEIGRVWAEAQDRKDLALPPRAHFASRGRAPERLARAVLEGGGLSLGGGGRPLGGVLRHHQRSAPAILSHGEEGALTRWIDLERWREMRVAVAIACGSAGQVDRVKRPLDRERHGPGPRRSFADGPALLDPSVWAHLFTGEISRGFVDPGGGLAVLSDEEIFGARARRRVARRSEQPFGAAFRELKEGDLIVHTDFGIGRYAGLTKMQVQGIPGDFLVLEYAGRDKIYLPVSRMRLIQKFTGGDPSKVALDKLGGTSWLRTKARAKETLLKMAAELLRLYAARHAHPGFSFTEPDRYFRQFEADFEFDETPDQAKAIEEVLADMQKPEPMDRRFRVGYGRPRCGGAFKAARRRQVAVVPTTVLAQQHFHTFGAVRRLPGDHRGGLLVRKAQESWDVLRRARTARSTSSSGRTGCSAPTSRSRTWGPGGRRGATLRGEAWSGSSGPGGRCSLTATPDSPDPAHVDVRAAGHEHHRPRHRTGRAIRTFVTKFDHPRAVLRSARRAVFLRPQRCSRSARWARGADPRVTIGVAHGQMGQGSWRRRW
jgi:transcription-repair coupling factor (superfamily II helicase)